MLSSVLHPQKTSGILTPLPPSQLAVLWEHLAITYIEEANGILAFPMKSKSSSKWLRVVTLIHTTLQSQGFTPTLHTFDNELPLIVQTKLRQNNITVQFVPPHVHRDNSAERAIETFKNHFISGIASVHTSFLSKNWPRFVPQANRTINQLRKSNHFPIYPHITISLGCMTSTKHQSPPGAKILIHLKPNQRGPWSA